MYEISKIERQLWYWAKAILINKKTKTFYRTNLAIFEADHEERLSIDRHRAWSAVDEFQLGVADGRQCRSLTNSLKKSSQFEPESLGTESCIHLIILGWELSVKLDRNAVGEWHKLTLCHFIYNEVVSFSCRLTRKTSAIIRNPTFTFILLN